MDRPKYNRPVAVYGDYTVRPDVALAVLETQGRVTAEQCEHRTALVQARRDLPDIIPTTPWSAL
jgi:hypothetical protein